VTMPLPKSPHENLVRVRSSVASDVASASGLPVFLVDGDRTLTPQDTSRVFLSRAGFDPAVIKARFQRDGYCFDAFRFHAEVHVSLGEEVFGRLAPEVAQESEMFPGALAFLGAAKMRGRVFVVSAGIPRIWRHMLDLHGLSDVGVIGGIEPRAPFVFGRAEKGFVAEMFSKVASQVVAVGDSDVDADMLTVAHHAVVVTNQKRNIDLRPHLEGHPSCWQVVAVGAPLPHLRVLSFEDVATLAVSSASALEFPCP
jgi:phosphoserine phosphatase